MKSDSTTADGAARGRSREIAWLVAIVLLALAVRAAFLARWAETSLFFVPTGDELNFHLSAQALISAESSMEGFLYQPLYGYFLAALYSLCGVSVTIARSVQLVIGAGTCLLVYGLGRELGGEQGRWVGRIAAMAVALYGPQVFFEAQLLAPVLTVPLTTGALWCLLRAMRPAPGGQGRGIVCLSLSGLLCGLACMGRPNLVIIAVVAAGWLVFRPGRLRHRLLSVGLLAGGVVLGLSPSWIHNAVRGQGFTPVSTSGGHSFFLGNNPEAPGWFHLPASVNVDDLSHRAYRHSWKALAERAEGRRLTPSQVSSYWLRQGLEFWRSEAGAAMALTGKKLLLVVHREELAIHTPFALASDIAPWMRHLVTFAVLLTFALAGAWLGFCKQPGVAMLASAAAAYAGTLALFYVADRYRILLLPMLAPLFAWGIVELCRRLRAGGFLRALPGFMIAAFGFGLTQLPVVPASYTIRARAHGYNRMGKAWGDAGRLDQAEASFRRAIELGGRDGGLLARTNLGRVHELRGDMVGAERIWTEAARRAPRNRVVRHHLARLAERRGDLGAALLWWREIRDLSADPSAAEAEIARLKSSQGADVP